MSYQLTKLATALLSPLGMALVVWVLVVVLLWRARRSVAALSGLLAIGWLWVWATPAASDALVRYVEAEHPAIAIQAIQPAQAIVVLGGAISPPNQWREYPDMGDASDRVWHAARLWKAGKAPIVVLSGGSDPSESRTSEALAMRVLLTDLGVPSEALWLEEKSRTTRENALFTALMLRARGIDKIILVTSASHMPRALALFRAEGLQVVPASTDFQAGPVHVTDPVLRWVPDTGALHASSRALKEIVGRAFLTQPR